MVMTRNPLCKDLHKKGKCEKFHQIVDRFLAEVKVYNIRTLEGLNRHWSSYLEKYYHTSPHAGIRKYYESMGVSVPEGGIYPVQEWNRDSRPLTFLDASVVAESSRLLDALEKKQAQSMQRRADAISFGSYRKDGGDHV